MIFQVINVISLHVCVCVCVALNESAVCVRRTHLLALIVTLTSPVSESLPEEARLGLRTHTHTQSGYDLFDIFLLLFRSHCLWKIEKSKTNPFGRRTSLPLSSTLIYMTINEKTKDIEKIRISICFIDKKCVCVCAHAPFLILKGDGTRKFRHSMWPKCMCALNFLINCEWYECALRGIPRVIK